MRIYTADYYRAQLIFRGFSTRGSYNCLRQRLRETDKDEEGKLDREIQQGLQKMSRIFRMRKNIWETSAEEHGERIDSTDRHLVGEKLLVQNESRVILKSEDPTPFEIEEGPSRKRRRRNEEVILVDDLADETPSDSDHEANHSERSLWDGTLSPAERGQPHSKQTSRSRDTLSLTVFSSPPPMYATRSSKREPAMADDLDDLYGASPERSRLSRARSPGNWYGASLIPARVDRRNSSSPPVRHVTPFLKHENGPVNPEDLYGASPEPARPHLQARSQHAKMYAPSPKSRENRTSRAASAQAEDEDDREEQATSRASSSPDTLSDWDDRGFITGRNAEPQQDLNEAFSPHRASYHRRARDDSVYGHCLSLRCLTTTKPARIKRRIYGSTANLEEKPATSGAIFEDVLSDVNFEIRSSDEENSGQKSSTPREAEPSKGSLRRASTLSSVSLREDALSEKSLDECELYDAFQHNGVGQDFPYIADRIARDDSPATVVDDQEF